MRDDAADRIAALFLQVAELAPAERAAHLDAADVDPSIRAEVESLLAHDVDDGFLEQTPVRSAAPPLDGARFGAFTLEERLGAGAAGVVYRAMQAHPARRVALKILHRTRDDDRARQRFDHEAHVLAALDHPGIATIFEAGYAAFDDTSTAQPYLAMEFIDGRPLDAFVRERTLDPDAILALLEAIAHAVHHAHQKGVIHRDLKPANIIVTADGAPKVVDFGIARATDDIAHRPNVETREGELLGTVPYMSPEQAAGRVCDIDVRTDVHALGVIAFQLLSGTWPHPLEGCSVGDALRMIQHDAPRRLGTVAPWCRGDLETIVRTALAPNPEERYPSVAAFADDLHRFRTHQPITAQPPSPVRQLRLFARRHRIAVGATAAIVVILLTATIISARFAMRATQESAQRAHQQLVAERVSEQLRYLLQGPDPARLGPDTTMAEMLAHLSARLDDGTEMPEVEADVRTTIATTYNFLELYDLGRPELERAVTLWRAIDPHHERLPGTLADLARAYGGAGRIDEAIPLFEEALAILDRRPGGAFEAPVNGATGHRVGVDADGARIAGRLVTYLTALERFEEAETHARRLVANARAHPGRDHVGHVLALRRLARIRGQRGDHTEQCTLLDEAVVLARAHLAPRHPLHAGALYAAALAHRDTESSARALALADEARRASWSARPPGSADWMLPLVLQVELLRDLDRASEITALLDDADAILGRDLPADADARTTLRTLRTSATRTTRTERP